MFSISCDATHNSQSNWRKYIHWKRTLSSIHSKLNIGDDLAESSPYDYYIDDA